MSPEETKALLQEIQASQAKIEISTKINSLTLRGAAGFFGIVSLFFIGFMISASERITAIESTLITSENVVKMKKEINDKFSTYLKMKTYFEIEHNRALTIIDYIDFVAFEAGIKEEELERARAGTIRALNTYSGASAIRSQKKATKERTVSL
jgi:hypothetical protein